MSQPRPSLRFTTSTKSSSTDVEDDGGVALQQGLHGCQQTSWQCNTYCLESGCNQIGCNRAQQAMTVIYCKSASLSLMGEPVANTALEQQGNMAVAVIPSIGVTFISTMLLQVAHTLPYAV